MGSAPTLMPMISRASTVSVSGAHWRPYGECERLSSLIRRLTWASWSPRRSLRQIQTYTAQPNAKASEMFHGLVLALYEAQDLLDLSAVLPRGRWGSPTARAFVVALKNAFAEAVAKSHRRREH